jgi:hypothetical protein
MKINTTLAALLLITAGTVSSQAMAQENNGVKEIVANIVNNAIHNVSQEIDHQVQKLTLTASNTLSIQSPGETLGKVSISDIASTPATKANSSDKSNDQKDKSSQLESQETNTAEL